MYVKNAGRAKYEGSCKTCAYLQRKPLEQPVEQDHWLQTEELTCHNPRSRQYRYELGSELCGCPCWALPTPAPVSRKKRHRHSKAKPEAKPELNKPERKGL